MQGLYLSDVPDVLDKDPKTGIAKKIQAQVKTLCNAGLNCENRCLRKRPPTTWDKIRKRLALFGDGLNWQVDEKIKNADYLYIRRPSVISWSCISFLKKVKKTNSRCRLIMELPTYPYDQELCEGWHNLPVLWQDRFFRKSLHKYLDRIAILTDDDEVFGIPTVKIQNGVDLSSYRIKKQNKDDTLNIGCAAQFSFWHGIDRMLQGMAAYDQCSGNKKKVHLYLAGEGPQSDRLKQQAKELDLNHCVTFLGNLNQDELYQQIFDHCDMGLECLANHRHAVKLRSSSLKSREYLAVGLPVMFAGELDVFEKEPADFFHRIEASDAPVDIEAVVRFYEELLKNETKEQLSIRIRSYAERYIGWNHTFAGVIDWLKQESIEIH